MATAAAVSPARRLVVGGDAENRFGGANQGMVRATSLASIGLGLFLAYKLGVQDGLFSDAPLWVPQ